MRPPSREAPRSRAAATVHPRRQTTRRPPLAWRVCSRTGRYSTITIAPGTTARLDLAATASQPSSDFAAASSSCASGSPCVPGAPSAARVAHAAWRGACSRAASPRGGANRVSGRISIISGRAMPGIVGCGQTLWREGYRARAGCSSHARVGRSTARCLRIKRLAYRHRQASTSYRLAALAIQHGVQRGLPSSSGTATHLQKGSAPATTSRLAPSASRRSERQPSL